MGKILVRTKPKIEDESLEKINLEQEQSLAELEAQNAVGVFQDEYDPFERWDEVQHTPEYMQECAEYASNKLVHENDDPSFNESSYKERLNALKDYFYNEFGEDGLIEQKEFESADDYNKAYYENAEQKEELSQKEKLKRTWHGLQYAYYGYEALQGHPEIGLKGMFVKWGMEIGNNLIDSAVQTVRGDDKDANTPDSKQKFDEIDVQQTEEHAGALNVIETKREEKDKSQQNDKIEQKNEAVEKLMAKYEKDKAAYEERNAESEQNQSVLESKQMSKRYDV